MGKRKEFDHENNTELCHKLESSASIHVARSTYFEAMSG